MKGLKVFGIVCIVLGAIFLFLSMFMYGDIALAGMFGGCGVLASGISTVGIINGLGKGK